MSHVIDRIPEEDLSELEKAQLEKKRGKNYNFVQFYKHNMKAYRKLISDNPTAAQIFMFLTEHMTHENAVTCSNQVLQEQLGKGRTTIWRALKVLKDSGFIEIYRLGGGANTFTLNKNVVWMGSKHGKEYCYFEGPVLISVEENKKLQKRRVNELSSEAQ